MGGQWFFVYRFGAIFRGNTAVEPPQNPPWYYGQGRLCPVRLLCFGIVSVFILPVPSAVVPAPVFGGVSLSLVRSFRSGFLRFPAGSRCVTSPGSISHTGRSFDWNNPSMNCLYHRTFLYPVPYIHKVGIKPEIRKFPRLWNECGIMVLLRQAGRRKGE